MKGEFEELDAHIVGISADQVGRQLEFAQENNLSFPLLSDTDKSVARQFGVKRMGPFPSKRATFVIGADKKLLADIRSETDFTSHADKALEALRVAAE